MNAAQYVHLGIGLFPLVAYVLWAVVVLWHLDLTGHRDPFRVLTHWATEAFLVGWLSSSTIVAFARRSWPEWGITLGALVMFLVIFGMVCRVAREHRVATEVYQNQVPDHVPDEL